MNLSALYYRLVIDHPRHVLAVTVLCLAVAGWYARYFELDASSESLVLENDASLNYYRQVSQRYASDDFIVITYEPDQGIFSPVALATIRAIRDELLQLQSIATVNSILDVPIIYESGLALSDLAGNLQSMDNGFSDMRVIEQEFRHNPLYRDLLVNDDLRITAIQAVFRSDPTYQALLQRRIELQAITTPDPAQIRELEQVRKAIRAGNRETARQRESDIARIRAVMQAHTGTGTMYLGGIPMITVDMIQFIKHDLRVFGLGVFVFLVLILFLFFHRVYWVTLPMLICFITGLLTVGFLGLVDWPVTVISSNFLSITLIITLSLTIHLIVRYRDLQLQQPGLAHLDLVRATIGSMALPCFYTIITTVVAFASLVVCEIRPVVDFGWIMVVGLLLAFVISFTVMPALLSLVRHVADPPQRSITGSITLFIARVVRHVPGTVVICAAILLLALGAGITRLKVENRFINNFNSGTEIYQGMKLIDSELGGTMPLDIVLDPDQGWLQARAARTAAAGTDELEAAIFADPETAEPGYWLNETMVEKVKQIHARLEAYPVIGKVVSIMTAIDIFEHLNGQPFDSFELGLLRRKIPEQNRVDLFDPYLSADADQLRISMRVIESDPDLNRAELLQGIASYLVDDLHLEPGQVHLTGMMELYNNMLQSLFRSQILSLGAVFLAIMAMFVVLFRNLQIALIAIIPNLFSTVIVLGVMGWAGIPLDMMTITIASITIGISVDDTIHYLHRLQQEFPHLQDYHAAVDRCHGSIGKAMYYTSLSIMFGFAILAFSNFVPTVYFGLLTGLAMSFALAGDLILLPALVLLLKPRM